MKIVAFGASSSKNSINKKLAIYATTYFEEAEVEILDLNDYEMPLFSVDKEKEFGFPIQANRFLEVVGTADLLIVSMSEHNGSYTTAFKNILDWASRINGKVFQSKPMLLMATSPGRRGGQGSLDAAKSRFPFHAANILASFSLPEFENNFSETEGIINEELRSAFELAIKKIVLES